jgi:anaerobic selenocysteine-containing dehydrogenase
VLVHPADAARAGVIDGARVMVTSATGSLTAVARLDPDLRPGVVSVAHGWEGANVNHLISSRDDVEPLTGMPRSSGTVVVLAAEAVS